MRAETKGRLKAVESAAGNSCKEPTVKVRYSDNSTQIIGIIDALSHDKIDSQGKLREPYIVDFTVIDGADKAPKLLETLQCTISHNINRKDIGKVEK